MFFLEVLVRLRRAVHRVTHWVGHDLPGRPRQPWTIPRVAYVARLTPARRAATLAHGAPRVITISEEQKAYARYLGAQGETELRRQLGEAQAYVTYLQSAEEE